MNPKLLFKVEGGGVTLSVLRQNFCPCPDKTINGHRQKGHREQHGQKSRQNGLKNLENGQNGHECGKADIHADETDKMDYVTPNVPYT